MEKRVELLQLLSHIEKHYIKVQWLFELVQKHLKMERFEFEMLSQLLVQK
jgi:hypothetical protein